MYPVPGYGCYRISSRAAPSLSDGSAARYIYHVCHSYALAPGKSVYCEIPMRSQIIFLATPSCRYAKICDLCSEVSCLYMCNTKLILGRLRSPFFVLLDALCVRSRGRTRPLPPLRHPPPRRVRRKSCFYLKVLHFDFETTPSRRRRAALSGSRRRKRR